MSAKFIVLILVVVVILVGGAIYLYAPKFNANNYSNTPVVPSANQPSAETYNIEIKNFAFNPAETSISVGDTVTWTNQDAMPHKISGNGFLSQPLSSGQTYSFTFNNAGTFDYICAIHPSMKGRIIVK